MAIEDSGEFIPGAKKHMVLQAGVESDVQLTQEKGRLQALWPEPDWVLLELYQRYSPRTLGLIAATYWSLGTGPIMQRAFGIDEHEWPILYEGAIAVLRQAVDAAGYDDTLGMVRRRAEAILGITRESTLGERMRLMAAGRFSGRQLFGPCSLTPKLRFLAESMVELGWPKDGSSLKACIGVMGTGDKPNVEDKVWAVICTQPTPHYVDDERFTRTEALARARLEIQKRLEEKAQERARTKLIVNKASKAFGRREGPDYLAGRDVTPENLMSAFNLRGIQFGESLSEKEKQIWLNEAYLALLDLADAIGFKYSWMGLGRRGGRTLALAIGARGKAGSSAHYEPDLMVVNLTRSKGAGSLAHEWGHALDHHLRINSFSASNLSWSRYELMSEHVRVYSADRFVEMVAGGAGKVALYRDLCSMVEVMSSDAAGCMYEHAEGIEQLRGARKDYWTRTSELWARSFESYVQDALLRSERASPWLVYGTAEAEQVDAGLSPYPIGAQRTDLCGWWDKLFVTLTSGAVRSDA